MDVLKALNYWPQKNINFQFFVHLNERHQTPSDVTYFLKFHWLIKSSHVHLSQSHYSILNVNNNKDDELKSDIFVPDWLKENEMDANFEVLSIEDLADMLRRFYGTVLSKKGNEYSRSGLVNLRAGLNHHLQEP